MNKTVYIQKKIPIATSVHSWNRCNMIISYSSFDLLIGCIYLNKEQIDNLKLSGITYFQFFHVDTSLYQLWLFVILINRYVILLLFVYRENSESWNMSAYYILMLHTFNQTWFEPVPAEATGWSEKSQWHIKSGW